MKNKITVTGVNIVFFIFVMLFLLFQPILLILTQFYGENFIDKNMYAVLLINEYILILLPVIAYMIIKKISFHEVFRLNKLGAVPAVLIAILSVPAYLVALFLKTIVIYILQFIGDIPVDSIPVPNNMKELVIGILVVALSPAICEELLHRGILLKAYENRGTTRAIIITSVFFGFFHFDITNFLGPIFLGLLIGYYVVRTNSILAGILAHFCNNAIAEFLQYYGREEEVLAAKITISSSELGFYLLLGLAGSIFVIVFLSLLKRVTEGIATLKPAISSVKEDFHSVITHWPVMVTIILYILMGGLYLLVIISSKLPGFQLN